MVTHERDLLQKDVKRHAMEREVKAAAAAASAVGSGMKYGGSSRGHHGVYPSSGAASNVLDHHH